MHATPFQAIVAAPGFCIGVRCDADEITELLYLPPQPGQAPRTPLACEAVRQLRAWIADPRFGFGLPLRAAGTAFQRRVWEKIAAIPCGATRSYGEIARELRTAALAVGQACGANPYPVVVPCHRVIASNGSFGGFANARDGWLLDTKRWLLAHEAQAPAAPVPGGPSHSASRSTSTGRPSR